MPNSEDRRTRTSFFRRQNGTAPGQKSVKAATRRRPTRRARLERLESREMLAVVFSDTFPASSFNSSNWATVSGATIDTAGLNEPSSPYSARLNGNPSGGDRLESTVVDLSSSSSATLSYHYERTGGGESPESGDDLIVEYRNSAGSWVELERQSGSGSDMTSYLQRTINLPAAALHGQFRFRFRSVGFASTSNFDDWFVDNVEVDATSGGGGGGGSDFVFIVGENASFDDSVYRFQRPGSLDGTFAVDSGILTTVATDGSSVYVGDFFTEEIRRYAPDGTFQGVFVDATGQLGTGADLSYIEFDGAGNLYAASAGNSSQPRVSRRYNSSGNSTGTFSHPSLVFPGGIDADASGNVYILNSAGVGVGDQLFKFSSSGSFLGMFAIPQVNNPQDMAIDEANRVLYIGDEFGGSQGIEAYNISGSTPSYIGSIATPGLTGVLGISFDPASGHLFAADNDGAIELTTSGSVVNTYAGGTLDRPRDIVRLSGGGGGGGGGDSTPPTVTSRSPAPGSTITTTSVNIDVTFSEPVTGVDASDLVLTGSAGGTVATPSNTSGNTWRFAVGGLATGTLNVSLAPDAGDIEDTAGNDLANVSWSYPVSVSGGGGGGGGGADFVFIVGEDPSFDDSVYRFQRPGSLDGTFAVDSGILTTVATDGSSVYVGDFSSDEIRRYAADGTFQGVFVDTTGQLGSGGDLNHIEFDGAGNLYATPSGFFSNPRVSRRYNSSGSSTGTFSHPSLVFPGGIDADASGNVYILNSAGVGVGDQLFKFSSSGSFLGMFAIPQVNNPRDMAIDEANRVLYIGDEFGGSQGIKAYNIAGSTPSYIGSIATPGLTGVLGISFDPASGHLFAADNDGAIELTTSGSVVNTYAGGTLDRPRDIVRLSGGGGGGGNNPPAADAGGPYTVAEGQSLMLDGSGSSDPDGDPLSYRWDVDGDGDYDENVTGVSPTLTWSQLVALGLGDGPTSRTVELEVDDGKAGGTATDTTMLTVTNSPPIITDFTVPASVITGNSVNLSATATDPAGPADPLTFQWTITRPDSSSFNLSGTSPGFVATQDGVYGVSLVVSDGDGDSDTASASTTSAGTRIDVSGGHLRIRDVQPGGKADTLTLRFDAGAGEVVVSDPNHFLSTSVGSGDFSHTVRVPLGDFSSTGQIQVLTADGNDSLTVDFSLGNFPREVSYEGGTPTSGPGDSLSLSGGSFATATYEFFDASSGAVHLTGNAPILYSELEPITASIAATDVVLNYSSAAETITVTDPGGGNTAVNSTAGESLTFANPSGSLTIHAGDTGDDQIHLNGLAAAYPASIAIDGGTGRDLVRINDSLHLADDQSLSVQADIILLTNPSSQLRTGGSGAVSLIADRNVVLAPGSSITTEDGPLTLENGPAGSPAERFVGIVINGAALTSTGGGDITITGRGGNEATSDNHHGLVVTNGAAISSTGSGSILLQGTGGDGTRANRGVMILGSATTITSIAGPIDIVGVGGPSADDFNQGIFFNGGTIASSGAAAITLQGEAGASAGFQSPGIVFLGGGNAEVRTHDGPLTITGTGRGTGTGSGGVLLLQDNTLRSTGTGTIDISGNAASAGAGRGVIVFDNALVEATAGADISLSGLGSSGLPGVQVNGTVRSGTGAVTAVAEDELRMGPIGRIDSASGPVTLIADGAAGDNGSPLMMFDGALVAAGSGGIHLEADGDVTLGGLVTSGQATVTSHHGELLDGGAAHPDIVADRVALRAANGIGADDPLDTDLNYLAAWNSTQRRIRVDNSAGGLLTITTVDALVGVTNAGPGDVRLAAHDMEVLEPVTATIGNIDLFSSHPVRTIGLGSGGAVKGSGFDGTNAAFKLTDAELDRLVAGGARQFFGGSSADLFNVHYGGGDTQPLTVLGFDGEDHFYVAPASTLPLTLDGGAPSAPVTPGDTLHLDMSGAAPIVIVDTIGGVAVSGNSAPLSFSEMETLDLCDNAGDIEGADMGDLYVRTTDGRERIVFTLWNDGGVKLRVDDYDARSYTTFPQHFGLVGGVQQLEQLVVHAAGGDDYVVVAGHVVDGNDQPISVEFHGEDGDDYLAGGLNDDVLVGGPGADRLLGGEGNNVLFGDGNEFDAGGSLIEAPGDGDDQLSGRGGNDHLWGGGGRDYLIGSSGNDVLNAGSGSDFLDGGEDTDILRGESGDDTLSGSYGNDILLGGSGRDRVYGRQGHDILLGGEDADYLIGDDGDDLLIAGTSDQDTADDAALLSLLSDWSTGRVDNFSGIQGDGQVDYLYGRTGDDRFWAEILPAPGLDHPRDLAPGEVVNDEA